ncbi:MAG: hypothetical protein ABW173_09760 [Sphingomonas sp.]
MSLTNLAELDAARDRARSLVHRRALKAAGRAAVPFGFGHDAIADLVADVQTEFRHTDAEKAELAPKIQTGLAQVIAAYAPGAIGAEAAAGLAATLASNPIARFASRRAGGRIVRRVVAGRGLLGTLARRAWLIPAALGGGAAASYEVLGRRAINACYAYSRAKLDAAAGGGR